MSFEKLGAIYTSDGKTYSRRVRGITLPTDSMTDKEIAKLSGEVKTYHKDDVNEKVRVNS